MRLVRQQFAISMEEFAPVLKEIRELEALWRINSERFHGRNIENALGRMRQGRSMTESVRTAGDGDSRMENSWDDRLSARVCS